MDQLSYIGPIGQLLTFSNLPVKGPLKDTDLPVLENAGILTEHGKIKRLGPHDRMVKEAQQQGARIFELNQGAVALPGFVDAHTHICFAGSRAADYAVRNSGGSYLEIAQSGGGIWQTVEHTRKASEAALVKGIVTRAFSHLQNGVTTIEVKSGYGLNPEQELKMLRAIDKANSQTGADLIPTCLAAHVPPKEFIGKEEDYLLLLWEELLPEVKKSGLSNRVDIFIEAGAFDDKQGMRYLNKAKEMGYDLTVHADQFSVSGSALAIAVGALSADHLEASGPDEIRALAKSNVICVALPGASLGLGCPFTPARALLDAGGALAIASDHNPGSAPMGQLITQAAILGSFEKLSNAEVLSGVTFRAAAALGLTDRGQLIEGFAGDIVIYNTTDYREILYHQGSLKPSMVFKNGNLIYNQNKAS